MPKLRKKTKADISAVFSDDVAVRKYRNQNIISTIKRPKKTTSDKREASKKRLTAASIWAKSTLKDPSIEKLYSKGITERLSSAHTVATTDYLNPPTIHYISLKQHTGAIGDKIRIKATDDFQVIAVDVTIKDKNGKEIEKGPAERYKRKPQMWIYTLTVANPEVEGTVIKVRAMDRPENKTFKEVKIEKPIVNR
jgi:hypothetical protein